MIPAGLFLWKSPARHQASRTGNRNCEGAKRVDLLLRWRGNRYRRRLRKPATAVVSVVPDAESIGTADDAAIMRSIPNIIPDRAVLFTADFLFSVVFESGQYSIYPQ